MGREKRIKNMQAIYKTRLLGASVQKKNWSKGVDSATNVDKTRVPCAIDQNPIKRESEMNVEVPYERTKEQFSK